MERSEQQGLTREQSFLKECFRRYYAGRGIEPPFRFTKREWGFFPFGGKMMFRHMAFLRKEDVDRFFRENAPMHAYYSSAYYGDPGLQPMGEKVKTWMGADLIFDLDADHIPDAQALPYEKQLSRVKEEIKRLIFDFLTSDFGFGEGSIELYFSGGRGYHVHIRDPDILRLDSKDRRAIVDYITGNNIDFDVLFPEYLESVDRFGKTKRKRNFRQREWGAWVSRIYEGKDRLIEKLSEKGSSGERVQFLTELSAGAGLEMGRSRLESLVRELFQKGEGVTARRMVGEDKFSLTSTNRMDEDFLRLVKAYTSIKLSGETDEPVTTDVKRLIRCPSSLHGKTGLKVVGISLSGLEDFDPLRDAVALPDDPVEVELKEDISMDFGGERYDLGKGRCRAPEHLAYFLVSRGKAGLPQ